MRTMRQACGAWIVWGCLASWAGAQSIPWQSDLEAAKQAAASSNRLVLMHFSASWCHWCKPLEKNVFGQPEVAQAIDANYVAVRMDYDQHRQIAKQYGVRGVPWDVVITPTGYWVEDFNSPQKGDEYATRISKIATREAAKLNGQYAANAPAAQPAAVPTTAAGTPMPGAVANGIDPYGPSPETARKPAADRYADYYSGRQSAPRVDPVSPPYAQQAVPGQAPSWPNNEVASAGNGVNMGGANAGPPTQYVGQSNAPGGSPISIQNAPYHTSGTIHPSTPPQGPGPLPAVAQPTFAIEGHCPVHLLEQSAWVSGDRRWGATHRGKTYLFVSEGCQKKFLADPDRFAPALSGNDPVALVDRGQAVAGRREHGCYFGAEPNRRVVLFSDEASFEAFSRNPQRYAGQILAPPQQ